MTSVHYQSVGLPLSEDLSMQRLTERPFDIVLVFLAYMLSVNSGSVAIPYYSRYCISFVVVHKTLGTISLATGVFTDIVTALSLCYYLSRFRTGIPAYGQSYTREIR